MIAEEVEDEWWDEEDDEWSEDAYYDALAAHFTEKYYQHITQYPFVDCE